MDRRREAGVLLALAACFACSAAAPTASNQTALDLYEGAPEGCYYNFQHYGEGDRIMTNEPCLNCTCHNRMLMCYLRVCPFTKPIGQDCTVEKRADQCCPIVTCPDVPVDLLTSTSTSSPAEYGATGLGKVDKYGCSIHGKYFPEGSKVPPTPNKPCEHCYCIRNMTTCVMQECTLHVDGCTPIYHKDVCCPVRYSCDHPEDEIPLLDDMSTTVRPTPGFLLTTTTVSPVTQMTQDCVHDDQIFADGRSIKTEKPCEHCYCMKGDIVCVVQECGTPMENEGKNCTSLPPREGQCCPDTYICEGDVVNTDGLTEPTTEIFSEKLTTLSPPMRGGVEGSGYRNEPDEIPYTVAPTESSFEGSGDEHEISDINELVTTEEPISIDKVGLTTMTDDYIKPYVEPTKTSDMNQIVEEAETHAPQYKTTTTAPKTEDFEKLTTSEITEEEILQPHDHLSTSVAVDESYETATTEMSESLVTELSDVKKQTIGLSSTSAIDQQESEITTLKPVVSESEVQFTSSHYLHTTIPNIEKIDETNLDVSSPPETPHVTSSSVTDELGSTEDGVTSGYTQKEHEKLDTTDENIKDIVSPTFETHVSSTESTDLEIGTTLIDHAENTIAVAEEESTHPYENAPRTTEKSILVDHDKEFTPSSDNSVIDDNTDKETHKPVTATEPVIKDIQYTTEEPDKGLNTIPNVIYEGISSEPSLVETKPTEVSSFESSTKIPDVTKGDLYTVTTEPSFRKEDEIMVSTEKQKEITTIKPEFVDDGLIPTSGLDDKYNVGSETSYTEEDVTTESKFPTTESYYPTSTISENVPDQTPQVTSKPIYELPSSTEKHRDESASIPVDIETHEEPSRIPGEGDCLLEGITYRNNSIVPSSNNCHSGCKCVSSIIKCDPIICSPPPNYNGNCQTIYDSPDSCCPTYVCDHPRETVPPQSDNQMSGTESPMSRPTIECHGDQCEITTPEKQEPEPNCGAEGCSSETQRPEKIKPTHQEPMECTGDKCIPTSNVCVGNGCQLPTAEDHKQPPQSCEGKDCETQEHPASQGLQDSNQTPPCQGDSCVNKADCGSNDCGTSDISDISHPTDIHDTPEDCNGELPCRRKETQPVSEYLPAKCEGADCDKKTVTTIAQSAEVSTSKPEAQVTEQQTYPESFVTTEINKEVPTTVDVNIETTEKTDHQQESSTPKEESLAPTPDTSTTVLTDIEQENTVPVEESQKPTVSQITEEDHEMKVSNDRVTESPVNVKDEKEPKPTDGDELSNILNVTVDENSSDKIFSEQDHLGTTEPIIVTNEVPQGSAAVSEQSTTIPLEIEEEGIHMPPQVDIEGTHQPVLGDVEQQTPTVITEKSTVEPVPADENTESYATAHYTTEKTTVTDAIHLEPTEVQTSEKPEEDVTNVPVILEDQDHKKPVIEESTDKLPSSADEISTPKTTVDEIETNDKLAPAGISSQKPELGQEIDKQRPLNVEDQSMLEPPIEEKEKPSITKEEGKPDISKEETKPHITKDDEKPVMSEEKPTMTKEEEKPDMNKEEENPSITKEDGKPVLSEVEEKPAITKEEVKPVATEEEGKPDMSEEEKPIITKEEEIPATSGEREKPAMTEEEQKPVTGEEKEKPAVTKKEEEPISGDQNEKPLITKEGEKPIVGDEKEKPTVTKEEEVPAVTEKEVPVITTQEGTNEPIEMPATAKPSIDKKQPTIGEILEENVQTQTSDTAVGLDKIDERFEGTTELPLIPEEESTTKPTESNIDIQITPTINREEKPSLPIAGESTTPSILDENQDQKTESEKPLFTEQPTTGKVTEISSKETTEKVIVDKTTQQGLSHEDALASTTEKPSKVTETTSERGTENKDEPITEQEITDSESTEEPSITEDKDDEKPIVDDLKKPILINEEDKGITSVTDTAPSTVNMVDEIKEKPVVSDKEVPVFIGTATDKPIKEDDETKATTTEYEKPSTTEKETEKDEDKLTNQLSEETPHLPSQPTETESTTLTIMKEKPGEHETPEEGSGIEMQLTEDLSKPESTTETSLESENIIPVQNTEASSELTPHVSQSTTDSRTETETSTEDALQKTTEYIIKINELETITKQPDALTSSHDNDLSITKSPQVVTTNAEYIEDTSEKIYETKTEQPQSEVTLGVDMQDQATGYDSTSAKSEITTTLPEIADKPTTKSSELLEKPDKEVLRDDVKYDHPEISTETAQRVTESTASVVTEPMQISTEAEDSNVTGYPEKSTESEPFVTEKVDQVLEVVTATPIATQYLPVSDTDGEHITMIPNIEKETREPLESSTTEASLITVFQSQEKLTEKYTPSGEQATTVSSDVSLQSQPTTLTAEEKQKPATEIPQQHVTTLDDKNVITHSDEIYTKKEESEPTVTQKIPMDASSTATKEETKVVEPITAHYTESYDLATTESPDEKSTMLDIIQSVTPSDHITSESPLSLVTDHDVKSTEQPHSATTQYYESSKHPDTYSTKEPENNDVPVAVTVSDQKPEIITQDEKITDRPIEATSEELVTSLQDTQTDSRTEEPYTKLPEITTSKSVEDIPKATEPEINTQFSETTPYLIELEEHTHKIEDDNLTPTSSEEIGTQDEHLSTVPPLYIDHEQTTRPSENDIESIVTTEKTTETEPVSRTTVPSSKPVEETTVVIKEQDKEPGVSQDYTTTTLKSSVVSGETTEVTNPQYGAVDSDASTVAPEKVTSESEKPTQPISQPENVPPEDEFIFATTKATTLKQEDEPAIQSLDDKLAKPDRKPETEEALPAITSEATKPGDVQPTDEIPSPEEEGHFPPSGSGGYGEPDYAEEDQAFGPGTCRYGGKVYVSAQQIPRDDPCDFCFCFRSDIICLQQSCPPPIHGCHEEPIQGFCCPRYECPVSMATTVNVTTTTTTTTTTLPPHFLTHAYKGAAQKRGCQIKGHTYKVGEVVRSSSGPCLHCTCGGDGQMKCDPKACTPEPMLRQMIAAAVSAKRRR